MTPPAPRLLVVDDNAELADNLAEILRDGGHAVRCAPSCAEAMRLCALEPFDVALVDLRLPDGDGTTLAQRLKGLVPDGQVVLLTGFATVESAARAVRAGACAYLVKPCATDHLLLTVEQAMRQVRLVAEKRELARRAQIAEKLAAVGTMTAGLSHEIRNPLNSASLQLQVLARRVSRLPQGEQTPLLEPLRLVQDEIRRLDRILEDFLEFARPRELVHRPVDISAALDKVLDLLAGEFEQRGVRLERRLDRSARAWGDEERIRQVLLNLGLNALQAVGEGGRVCVTCSAPLAVGAEPARVELTVDDDGPGIPPELRERVFEPFFTTRPQGTGLGLSIVHAIVVQHGGTIEALEGPLGGARLAVRLPSAD
ncbi:MAG TPA: ATP-binding protein [Anaeromyxobacter sp.]|nr:ATP-binding protein [Anaeromyxobacter sp.]